MHFLIFNISLSYLLRPDRNFKQQFLENIWRPAWEFCKVRDCPWCQDVWLLLLLNSSASFIFWNYSICNHFPFGLVWQYILVSKGVSTYLTTENIYFSKGQLNLCLNLRWAKGHCNYLLYYLCHIWVTMRAQYALPFIRKLLNKTQYNHRFCIQQIFYWTKGLPRKFGLWEHSSGRNLSRGMG